ncbi:MAG: LysM peptidoglycan-binding domain-containing protein [Lachnospiraceae bacterium]|nr:LysM peptidoglycan-binding domain-containing protein [Lachnospiraceae bacterium]
MGERKSTDHADYIFVRGIMEVPDFSRMKEETTAEKETQEVSVSEREEKNRLDWRMAGGGKRHRISEQAEPESEAKVEIRKRAELKNEANAEIRKRAEPKNEAKVEIWKRAELKNEAKVEIRKQAEPENEAKEDIRKKLRTAGSKEEKKEQERPGLWQAFQKRYGTQEEFLPENTEDIAADDLKENLKDNLKEKTKENTKENWAGEWKREQEQRFPGWEIQGCCVIGTYPSGRLEELSAHFPEAVRMLYHLQDQEERLYWQEGEQYEGVKGYFVFYEQNQKMQDYLSELFGGVSVEKEGGTDGAIVRFREKVKSKAEEQSQSFLRLASSFFVIGVLIVGAVVVNRVSDSREAQDVGGTELLSSVAGSQSADVDAGESDDALDAAGDLADALEAAEDSEEAVSGELDGTADEAVAVSGELDGTADDAAAVSGELNGATSDAVSVSGESALAGSDTFWADEEDGAGETSSGTGTTESEESAAVSVLDTAESLDSGAESSGAESSGAESSGAESGSAESSGAESGGAVSAEEESAAEATETASRQVQAAYVIREGDTLAEICARYYGSLDHMEALCEANGIEDANLILPGQKIVLP